MADDDAKGGESPAATPLTAHQKRKQRIKGIRAAANSAKASLQAPRFAVPGRPRALDPSQAMLDQNVKTILGAGAMNCTLEEVAALHDVGLETLFEFFERYPEIRARFEEAKLSGQASVKRNQFKLSEKSPQMAIYLGEQILGQRDPYKVRELEQRDEALKLRERDVAAREKAVEARVPDLGSGLPIDIKSLSLAQLIQLASRIRTEMEKGTTGGLTLEAAASKEPAKSE